MMDKKRGGVKEGKILIFRYPKNKSQLFSGTFDF